MKAEFQNISLSSITVPVNRARSYDPLKAQALASSISEQGLFNPITVRPVGDVYELVQGLHRFRAFEINEATTIEARVTGLSDDEAKLAEVMENLARVELIALDRCQHLYELKVVYERLYPEAVHGGNRRSEDFKTKNLRLENPATEIFSFAEHVAEQIGLSQRTIQIAVKIWKGLSKETRPRLYGTDLAKKQTELKALSELPSKQQSQVLDLIFDEDSEVSNVAGAVAAIEGGVVLTPAAKAFERIRIGFEALPDESLDRLIDEQVERVMASLKRMGRL